LNICVYFNVINTLEKYSVEWKSACVGVLYFIEYKGVLKPMFSLAVL